MKKKNARSVRQSLPRPFPVDDSKVRRPDISLARKILKWEPGVCLADGLKKFIHSFRGGSRSARPA